MPGSWSSGLGGVGGTCRGSEIVTAVPSVQRLVRVNPMRTQLAIPREIREVDVPFVDAEAADDGAVAGDIVLGRLGV